MRNAEKMLAGSTDKIKRIPKRKIDTLWQLSIRLRWRLANIVHKCHKSTQVFPKVPCRLAWSTVGFALFFVACLQLAV